MEKNSFSDRNGILGYQLLCCSFFFFWDIPEVSLSYCHLNHKPWRWIQSFGYLEIRHRNNFRTLRLSKRWLCKSARMQKLVCRNGRLFSRSNKNQWFQEYSYNALDFYMIQINAQLACKQSQNLTWKTNKIILIEPLSVLGLS